MTAPGPEGTPVAARNRVAEPRPSGSGASDFYLRFMCLQLWHPTCTVLDRKNKMKPSTEDQLRGTLHEVKGAVKEKAGQVTNNPNLEAEGQIEKLAGKVQKKLGQVEKVFEK